MLEMYEKELAELKARMEKAELFAEKIPAFRDVILTKKFTEKERCLHFGERYKDMYLGWGINRYLFGKGYSQITNYRGPAHRRIYLFEIYFNTLAMYDSYEEYGLDGLSEHAFFYDKSNSTFYVRDEDITRFLDAANEWFLAASSQAKQAARQEEIESAKARLKALEAWAEK